MQRVIKFKIWLPNLKKMSHPLSILDWINDSELLTLREDTIFLQWTGLTYKNGKEIYEGDKCKCRMNGLDSHIEEIETEIIYDLTVGAFGHKVISENSSYKFFGLNSKNLLNCEIIGNIYETPNY